MTAIMAPPGFLNADDLVQSMYPTAAALACAVADMGPGQVADILTPLTVRDLHALAVVLAAHIDPDKPFQAAPMVNPIAAAVRAAAIRFHVPEAAVLSGSRHRPVVDARAVACYVARIAGMSSTAIGSYVGRDHTTVLYACTRVGENPHLRAVAGDVFADLGVTTPVLAGDDDLEEVLAS